MAGGNSHRPFSVSMQPGRACDQIEIKKAIIGDGANDNVCKIFRLLPSERPNKQVTKLGNADGLLIH
ncbi:hypothetical protein EGJ52_12560 [Pseudomonas luteola]|nr:hypothetical protein EAW52_19710 [Pseudomonas sp. LTJR-52]RRW44027.1 hypothetical protein EGJ52_12560 [Pseudomonas luteola]